jgi:hypothetical protein
MSRPPGRSVRQVGIDHARPEILVAGKTIQLIAADL